MKILLYVNSHLPLIGGREMVVHHLAKEYQAQGHHVEVAGPAGLWRYRNVRFDYRVRRWPNVPLVPNDVRDMALLSAIKALIGFDLVHAHVTYPCGYIAARLKRWLGCPLVITPHGEDINVVPELGFGQRLDPEQNRKIIYALERADCATAISDTVFNSLVEAGMDPARIARISNGVDLERFQRRAPFDVYQFLGIPRDSRLIVSVGNYHPRKGHDVLVRAIAQAVQRVPKLRLAIIGRRDEAFCEQVKSQGLDEYVKFTGMLRMPGRGQVDSPDTLAAVLQAADIYVSSSVGEGAEGLSLALIEAMAAGACAVVSNVSGNKDFIAHRQNGLVFESGSDTALRDAIVDLCSDRSLLERVRRRGAEFVLNYGWQTIASRYLDLYRRLLDEQACGVSRSSAS